MKVHKSRWKLDYVQKVAWDILCEFSDRTFVEVEMIRLYHFRLTTLDGMRLDIFPKGKRYCKISNEGAKSNVWGNYKDLVDLLKEIFNE